MDFSTHLVFGFFAGIRPDGELQKIQWDDVKLAENTIVIRPEASKDQLTTIPDISANAAAWIEAYRQRDGTLEGNVSPYTNDALRKYRQANRRAAGLTKWIQTRYAPHILFKLAGVAQGRRRISFSNPGMTRSVQCGATTTRE